MQTVIVMTAAAIFGSVAVGAGVVNAEGDPDSGARVFRACVACHSLEPGRHMTGPSLAGLWERQAASIEGFSRYSPALKESGIIWDETTLDAWLADPQAFLPGNWMTFRGIKDAKSRADLIAFLQAASAGGGISETARGGMMRGPELLDLKKLEPGQQVMAIRLCGETYRVTTAAGELPPFWEFNLRFKTDSSDTGPAKGRPAIMPAGMMGDRASVIFSEPSDISATIEKKC